MLKTKEASKLWRICASARVGRFDIYRTGESITAISVANRDIERPEVVAILKGQETLWPEGTCNSGMTMWMALRTWYPYASKKAA
jgi:hypothetical protein